MKYTAKDVCKLFSINRETLRYYEKEGLLNPTIDDNNRYRYYDDWDINYILEIIQYRNMGFSIKEIKTILTEDNLTDYIDRLEKRRTEIKKQIDYQNMILDKNSEYINSLKLLSLRQGTYELVYSPSIYFVPLRKNFEFIFSEQTYKLLPLVLRHYEFFEDTVYIPYEDFSNQTESFYWIFTIEEKWLNALNIPITDMTHIPSQLCIRTVIDAKERWEFNYSLFDEAMDFISSNHLELAGNIFGYLLTRLHEDENYCRFIEVYIPVKKLRS